MERHPDPARGDAVANRLTAEEAVKISRTEPSLLAAALWDRLTATVRDELRVLAAAAHTERAAPRDHEAAVMSEPDKAKRLVEQALAVVMAEVRVQTRVGLFSQRVKHVFLNQDGFWFVNDKLVWQENRNLTERRVGNACGLTTPMDAARLLACIFAKTDALARVLATALRPTAT